MQHHGRDCDFEPWPLTTCLASSFRVMSNKPATINDQTRVKKGHTVLSDRTVSIHKSPSWQLCHWVVDGYLQKQLHNRHNPGYAYHLPILNPKVVG